MKTLGITIGSAVLTACSLSNVHGALAESSGTQDPSLSSDASRMIIDRSFSAIKYARTVRVLADGSMQFIRNESYPIQIARDAEGRVRMQVIDEDDLAPECDRPNELTPPPCPSWTVFVIDAAEARVTHWSEGEKAAHITLDMPLSQVNLERAIHSTSDLPALAPEIDSDATGVTTTDLGTKRIDGVSAHGTRTTFSYPIGHAGTKRPEYRVHEVWVAADLKLVVKVVDGDPKGFETIRGLEKISMNPDGQLFRAPAGYEKQRQASDIWAEHDFESLDSWFAR